MKSKQRIERINATTGLVINVFLFAMKLVAGVLGGSSALVADAVHSMTDVSTDIAVLIGSRYWHDPPDEQHTYGHGRIETIITFGIGIILGFTALQLTTKAITELISRDHHIVHFWIFWVAVSSIILKEVLFHYTLRVSRIMNSMALKANAWHHRTDSLSSVPVAFAIYLTSTFPDLWWVDSAGVLLVAVFIFKMCFDIVKPAFIQLVDTSADKKIIDEIEYKAYQIDGVKRVRRIRTRYVGSSLIAEMKINLDSNTTIQKADELVETIKKELMKEIIELNDISIIIVPYGAD